MLSEERHQIILDLLNSQATVTVTDLVARFQVSEMTVRRDLDMLARKGLLRRVRGGAMKVRGRSFEPSFLSRSTTCQTEKERIGRAAADLVNDGDSIGLDVGTTTLEVAKGLADKRNLTIITPSLYIASHLAEHPECRLILTGGILRPGELSLVGNLAERAFQDFFVDKLFLGVAGVDFEAGLTEYNLEDTLTKKAMLKSAKEIIVVADTSKFGQIAFAAVAPITSVDRIVTEDSLDPSIHSRLQDKNIDVILA